MQMSEERKNGLALAALIDQRLGAAERSARGAQEGENMLACFGSVDLSVGLLLGPACAGDKQQLRVGANGSGSTVLR